MRRQPPFITIDGIPVNPRNLLVPAPNSDGDIDFTAAAEQTPWVANIDGGGFNLTNAGVIDGTSINKVTITTPATGATLTIADGATATFNNSIAFSGTDATTMTFPPASASIGYLNVPANSQSANYTTVLADSGKSIDHPSTDANARTFTIDSNANVAYPIGTCISFSNMTSQVVSIAITSDTLNLAGSGATGTRSLAQYGTATARKVATTVWLISGIGLT